MCLKISQIDYICNLRILVEMDTKYSLVFYFTAVNVDIKDQQKKSIFYERHLTTFMCAEYNKRCKGDS